MGSTERKKATGKLKIGRKPAASSQLTQQDKNHINNSKIYNVYSMFPRPTNASFIDTTLNGYEFQTLVDTGNLSSSNLIDYKTIEGAYRHGRKRPPIRRLTGSIRAAGGAELDVIGTIQTEFSLGTWIDHGLLNL